MTERQIAVVTDYDGLIAAIRKHFDDMDVTTESIDDLAGLPTRYTAKLFAPVPIKTLSRVSMGPILGCGGLTIALLFDNEKFAKVSSRLRKRKHAGWKMLARKKRKKHAFRPFRDCPELAKQLRYRQIITQTPKHRSRIARKAARARWRLKRSRALNDAPDSR